MSSLFKSQKKAPDISHDNPGMGHTVKVAYANGEKTWEESFDLVKCLSSVLDESKILHKSFESFITISDEIFLQPQIVSLEPIHEGGAKTITTIEITSEKHIPRGIFEYQHSTGDNAELSVLDGFRGWVAIDLKVILEALNGLSECTSLRISYPNRDEDRVIVLGPVSYYASNELEIEEEHPFCSCCLFTNNFEAFKELLEGEDVLGVRFFVLRNEHGLVEADCRVNGTEFKAGEQSLIKYGETWPDRGFEFRKQYVVVTSESKGSDSIDFSANNE
ncbi:MAG: DUF6348 family protein [Pseudomonadota bacterium]